MGSGTYRMALEPPAGDHQMAICMHRVTKATSVPYGAFVAGALGRLEQGDATGMWQGRDECHALGQCVTRSLAVTVADGWEHYSGDE